jgi:hypothetical protein
MENFKIEKTCKDGSKVFIAKATICETYVDYYQYCDLYVDDVKVYSNIRYSEAKSFIAGMQYLANH